MRSTEVRSVGRSADISLSVWLSGCLAVCPSLCLSVSLCLSLSLSVSLCLSLSLSFFRQGCGERDFPPHRALVRPDWCQNVAITHLKASFETKKGKVQHSDTQDTSIPKSQTRQADGFAARLGKKFTNYRALSLSLCLSLCLSRSLSLSVSLSRCLSVCPPVCLSD